MAVDVDGPAAVRERLDAFGAEVLAEAVNRPVQVVNGGLYMRGLLEQGPRKSLEPMVARLGGEADYESLQNFLAVSPWDPARMVRAVAERVTPEIGVEAWVLDDTGFPKDGKDSPGVKRQYSGTLGKIGNCQIGVSVHAVGVEGTAPLGWALYLPEEWCSDQERRAKAKIPEEVTFKTKPELGVDLVEQAAGWEVPGAPVLGDAAYGENTRLRDRLDGSGSEYVLSVGPAVSVFAPGTAFAVPEGKGRSGRPRPDREPCSIGGMVAGLGPDHAETVTFRDGPDGEPMTSRFLFARVRAAHCWLPGPGKWRGGAQPPPREEWLIAEWPEGAAAPTDHWLSNLPADAGPERLARLARLRWKIELDYRQLKGELGLDHYEGRSWLGWHHHTALVTAAHGFLTLERLDPKARRPA
ncbi:MAG TPA: IS701 family transposase [Solirubrobacterales bacterium]|nr:IS701 family transposase [Solirubrobacterales bacterium]